MDVTFATASPSFEVRFDSLYLPGHALVFPCDAEGHVDLNALSERARTNYLFARAMVGRENSLPHVLPRAAEPMR
jgi:hypothetical protein